MTKVTVHWPNRPDGEVLEVNVMAHSHDYEREDGEIVPASRCRRITTYNGTTVDLPDLGEKDIFVGKEGRTKPEWKPSSAEDDPLELFDSYDGSEDEVADDRELPSDAELKDQLRDELAGDDA